MWRVLCSRAQLDFYVQATDFKTSWGACTESQRQERADAIIKEFLAPDAPRQMCAPPEHRASAHARAA